MTKTFASRITSTLIAAFTRISDADAAYRQAHKLHRLSNDHLTDMGLSRRDAQALMDMPHQGSARPARGRGLHPRHS